MLECLLWFIVYGFLVGSVNKLIDEIQWEKHFVSIKLIAVTISATSMSIIQAKRAADAIRTLSEETL